MSRSPSGSSSARIREDVARQLAFIKVYLLGPKHLALADAHSNTRGRLSQRELASMVGVSQPEVGRLLKAECTPRRETLARIRALYLTAKNLRWDTKQFYPICAISRPDLCHAYDERLQPRMLAFLHDVIEREPIYPSPPERIDRMRLDLHIRAATLPRDIDAYSFGNRPVRPSVFVVLVNDRFSVSAQYERAWDEVRAHVLRGTGVGDRITISRSVLSS
jgi:transcriptional regulator with XRE-family HTH domain